MKKTPTTGGEINEAQERERFEAWFKPHSKRVHLERCGDTYFGDWAACAWEGWLARAKLADGQREVDQEAVKLTHAELSAIARQAQIDFCLDKAPSYDLAFADGIVRAFAEKNGLRLAGEGEKE